MPTTRQVGQHWEREAESFLRGKGLTTRERNFQCRCGEIDLVMNDGDSLVFVEVRYLTNASHGSGLDTITRKKRQRLERAARFFFLRNPSLSQNPCRFDVISIANNNPESRFTWIRNAFDASQG
jgi:putative endonuclease